ncbi:MAG: hypothetical protein BGO51_02425 [Rhodospirillales bacterium 69-11]|nr:heme-binding protein [Rhodospirillales bacterium]MBN8926377.1 heme-binding protein [Rhodospirillales bacterium]OJW25443.1 MAG: hypothetical protein BGO51_02425 [Rhodospirillales bacterium 69-11]
MLSKFFYYATTFLEGGLAVFGLRLAEEPAYTVRDHVGQVEIRSYGPRVAVETTGEGDREAASRAAFERLFAYIAGANARSETVAMTAPVQQAAPRGPAGEDGRLIAMTAPVQTVASGEGLTMRFFLPASVAQSGAPNPDDPRVRLVSVPAETLAAYRFSGPLDEAARTSATRGLTEALASSRWAPQGAPSVYGYDPPFTIPFLRRNEVVVPVVPR